MQQDGLKSMPCLPSMRNVIWSSQNDCGKQSFGSLAPRALPRVTTLTVVFMLDQISDAEASAATQRQHLPDVGSQFEAKQCSTTCAGAPLSIQ